MGEALRCRTRRGEGDGVDDELAWLEDECEGTEEVLGWFSTPTRATGSRDGRGDAEWLSLLVALWEMLALSEGLTVALADGEGERDILTEALVVELDDTVPVPVRDRENELVAEEEIVMEGLWEDEGVRVREDEGVRVAVEVALDEPVPVAVRDGDTDIVVEDEMLIEELWEEEGVRVAVGV